MANVLSLALRVTADASQLKLDPVQRALVGLGDQADKLSGQFAKFSGDSDAAAKAQERFAKQSQDLINTLRDGGPNAAARFAAEFEKLAAAADKEAAAFERAAKITEANLSNFERFTRTQRELKEQVDAGRISQETYTRALEGAAKGLTDAERAAAGLGASQKQIADSAASTTLKFNELSGVFAVLPGPLGNIAGRISGIASASEGLSRIFAGGLRQGVSNLVGSFTALINPVTVGLAGIAAFAAGAASVARGLVSLEDRVEKLGNLANQLGTSFEFVQSLEEAGKRTGVSIESVSTAFGKLQRTLADGGEEGEKANKALGRLGVTVNDLAGLSEDDKIRLLGRQIAAIKDPAERSAAAVALFGRQGLTLLPFFDNLERAEAAMQKFGAAISDVDRSRIDGLGNAFDDIGTALTGLGNALLVPFAGLVEGVSNAIANAIGAVSNSIRPFLEFITPGLDALGKQFTAWGEAIFAATTKASESLQGIGNIFSQIFDVLSGIVTGVGPGISAYFDALTSTVSQLAKVFFDSFNAIFEAVSSLTSAVAGLFGFGDNLTGVGEAIGAAFGAVYSVLAQVVTAIGDFIEIANRVATVVVVGITKGIEAVVRLVTEFLRFTGLASVLEAIGGLIGRVFGGVASVFSTIASAIGGTVGRLLTLAENFLGIDRSASETAASVDSVAGSVDKATESTKQLVDQQKQSADEAKKQADAVQRIVDANLEQLRIENEFGGDSSRFRAAENLLVIQGEIARVEEQLRAAREAGDQATINALTSRLATLDQVAARENDIASGAKKQREEAQKEADRAAKEAERAIEQAAKDAEKLAEQRRKAEEQINEQIADARLKLGMRDYEIELERAKELSRIRTGSVKINDLRSGGISAFFDTLKEDPAIAEAKAQTKELQAMRKEIAKLNAEKVDILAGTG
jgi:phage-related protein